MSIKDEKNDILWIKALLNGIFAWILGFIIYMIPGLIVAFKMGFELGPKSADPSAVSEQISQTISTLYQNNLWLTIGFIVFTALLVFWRARTVAKSTGDKRIINGLLAAVFPVLISMLFFFSTGFDLTSIIMILVLIGAGYAGGYLSR
ncbi:hypothetical protein JXB12_05560 [candidate division KSB1 bacterium]|nr:hypothetical protein [candidate division KSB1 bacterium]